ncbi:alpha-L-arabinofuranosidase [Dinghuibacter silviterrae]|uniref:Alpha-L-arabinofuranosidase n=1 Tax=Dinghuibacter silviterrae TaxID=1539049 RepID=A0A4R8DIL1_9BACT|nr:alpha-L-arabinofuranosidase [Dinghuibacter silviterrae]TDW97581.1 hypothetical protein EDB95_5432 [Dinghuibacter silviterrae]
MMRIIFFTIALALGLGARGQQGQGGATGFRAVSQGSRVLSQSPQVLPQGFFLDAFRPKTAPMPAVFAFDSLAEREKALRASGAPPPQDVFDSAPPPQVDIAVYPSDTIARVSPWLFGNNANQWMGPMVNQPVLLDHIRTLHPGIIRYPGGNGSNTFFWNATPGQLPADVPDTLLYGLGVRARKERYFLGRAPWGLSVDNYYKMLTETDSKGIICVNMGYARYGTGPDPVATAAHLAADWVRYDHGRTRFWELGNEDNGRWQAGYLVDSAHLPGSRPAVISGDLYGRQARVFIDSMRAAARETGADIKIGVVLIELPPGPYTFPVDKVWNEGVLRQAGNACDFFIVHSYYTPYFQNSKAAAILATGRSVTDQMADYMLRMGNKPVALTEYNIFAQGSRQQTSFIAGMHAALVIGELATRGFGEATRWDLANAYDHGNDHGLFNKGDEPGAPLWNPRPAYYYLYYFQKCFGDHVVRSTSSDSAVVVFASSFSGGGAGRGLGLVLVNTSTTPRRLTIPYGRGYGYYGYYYSLTGGDDNGEFSPRVFVNGQGPAGASGGPADITHVPARRLNYWPSSRFVLEAPPRSVQFVVLY